MNQILFLDQGTEEKKKSNKKGIMKIFAIILIFFGVTLISFGAYRIWSEKSKEVKSGDLPVLSVEQNGSKVSLNLEYEYGISKLVYSWNKGTETSLVVGNKTKVMYEIEMPVGTNELNLRMYDAKGKLTNFSKKTFVFDTEIDSIKPEISIDKGADLATIEITVTDEGGLSYITYKWEGEEATKVDAQDGIDSQMMKQTIQVTDGTKKLIVTAVDKLNNTNTLEKIIIGSNKPEVVSVGFDGTEIILTMNDDDGISKIEYSLNGESNSIENINATEYVLKIPAVVGENKVVVKAYDINGLYVEYKGKCIKE